MKFTKQRALQLLLFAATLVIISIAMPHRRHVSYEYELGKPWNYNLLTAPFDMPINIDSLSAVRIKDSIDNHFVNIYTITPSPASLKALDNSLAQRGGQVASMRYSLMEHMRRIYENGVVDNHTYDEIASGRLPEVRTLSGNMMESIPTQNMLSVRRAYEELDSIFSHSTAMHHTFQQLGVYNYIAPNVVVDSAESRKLLEQQYLKALAPVGVIQQGERIIARGDVVTPQAYELLGTYERMLSERDMRTTEGDYQFAAGTVLLFLLVLSLYFFLMTFRIKVVNNTRNIVFLLSFVLIMPICMFWLNSNWANAQYLMPFAIVPIVITTFIDSRTALFVHIIVVLISSLVVPNAYEFIIVQFMAGEVAILSMKELSSRSQLAQGAFWVFLVYCVSYAAITLVHGGTIESLNVSLFGYFAINAVMLSFSYMLIFIVERVFGFNSTVTLVELSDINNPVLRELSEKCPGTFQHSMQVSTLAAEAAHAIGANTQLARAGALYHDIGKIDNPAFFTENQRGVNPHDVLTPQQSAKIVIEHVTNGLKRAERAKLPGVVSEFIAEHHGKGVAKYFLTQARNENPDAEIDEAPFTYPGPNPQSKETAIVMMADATEAASKSLSDTSEANIKALVERIIDAQIAQGLLRSAPLNFRDVETIKRVFISRLSTFYHQRVSYPDEVKPRA